MSSFDSVLEADGPFERIVQRIGGHVWRCLQARAALEAKARLSGEDRAAVVAFHGISAMDRWEVNE